MRKCGLKKFAVQLYWNHTSAWLFHIFYKWAPFYYVIARRADLIFFQIILGVNDIWKNHARGSNTNKRQLFFWNTWPYIKRFRFRVC